jgi:transcription elongation factor GreA
MPNFLTRNTYETLREKLRQIKEVEIPRISKAKQLAAEEGDLSENAEYIGCKEKLELLHSQYDNLRERIAQPTFIEDLKIPGNIVSIGVRVEIEEADSGEKTAYTILGSADVDLDRGIISFSSPLAKGMIGKKEGAEIDISVPEGIRRVKILSIRRFDES